MELLQHRALASLCAAASLGQLGQRERETRARKRASFRVVLLAFYCLCFCAGVCVRKDCVSFPLSIMCVVLFPFASLSLSFICCRRFCLVYRTFVHSERELLSLSLSRRRIYQYKHTTINRDRDKQLQADKSTFSVLQTQKAGGRLLSVSRQVQKCVCVCVIVCLCQLCHKGLKYIPIRLLKLPAFKAIKDSYQMQKYTKVRKRTNRICWRCVVEFYKFSFLFQCLNPFPSIATAVSLQLLDSPQ